MTTVEIPSPDNLIACESWHSRCLKLNQARLSSLCDLLGVKSSGLELALLEARTIGITHQTRQAVALWQDSENELAHAMSLLELAQKLHHEKSFKELDE